MEIKEDKPMSENEKLLKEIRHHMLCFFENEDMSRISLGITNMECSKDKNGITLTITLERPGFLIGRAGRTLDSLTEYLKTLLDADVKIKLVEDKTWYW